jgi:hypothetical protein
VRPGSGPLGFKTKYRSRSLPAPLETKPRMVLSKGALGLGFKLEEGLLPVARRPFPGPEDKGSE